MQAVIALCHFCEKHGPRVVVTCQPMRSLPSLVTMPIPSGYDRSSEGVNIFPSTSSEPELLPAVYGDSMRTYIDNEPRCGACTSLGTQQCLLSNDHPNKTSYITSQSSLKEEVNRRLREACRRSLTCEIAVPSIEDQDARPAAIRINNVNEVPDMEKIKEEEGHVSFGDAEMGMCLAYIFRIHDSKARGRKRLFSLLVLTTDASSLSIHHDFFLEALRRMKDLLQSRAYEIFRHETDGAMVFPTHQHASVNIAHLEKLLRDKVEIDPTRTLQVLTGCEDIFSDLHRCMMWTLRTQTMRFEDRLMGGTPTQDSLVLKEMKDSDIVELDLDQPNQGELTLQQLKNLRHISKDLARQGDLELLISHVITGGQIVAQAPSKDLAKQFLLSISNLLPIGCLRVNNSADRHYEPQQYNLMGCITPFPIPKNVLRLRVTADKENEDLIENCRFRVLDRPEQPQRRPWLLQRFISLILDEETTISTLRATMINARDDWLSASKLLYQLEQQAIYDAKFREKAGSNLVKYIPRCTENDRPLLKFWQNGISNVTRAEINQTIVDFLARR